MEDSSVSNYDIRDLDPVSAGSRRESMGLGSLGTRHPHPQPIAPHRIRNNLNQEEEKKVDIITDMRFSRRG